MFLQKKEEIVSQTPREATMDELKSNVFEFEEGKIYLIWFEQCVNIQQLEALRKALDRRNIRCTVIAGVTVPEIFELEEGTRNAT